MLPNDHFVNSVLASEPMYFPLPIPHVGLIQWNFSIEGWHVPVLVNILKVGDVIGEASTNTSETAYQVKMTQNSVYAFGLIFDLTPTSLYRRVHLNGYIRNYSPAYRCHFESFVVPREDALQIIIHIRDSNLSYIDLTQMSAFKWQVRDSQDNVVISHDMSDANVVDGKIGLFMQTNELSDLCGIYTHEAAMEFNNLTHTLFTGHIEFIPSRL